MRFAVLVLLGGLVSALVGPALAGEVFSFDQVRAGLVSNRIHLVDVREADEFATGHVPGATNLPLSSFKAEQLPPALGNPRRVDVPFGAPGRSGAGGRRGGWACRCGHLSRQHDRMDGQEWPSRHRAVGGTGLRHDGNDGHELPSRQDGRSPMGWPGLSSRHSPISMPAGSSTSIALREKLSRTIRVSSSSVRVVGEEMRMLRREIAEVAIDEGRMGPA